MIPNFDLFSVIPRNIDNISERAYVGELLETMLPPIRIGSRGWAEANRYLTTDVTSRPGKMDCMETPWMLYVMECLDDPAIRVIVGKKSAQIAWTETINNFLGRTIDVDPRNIMIAFPRLKSAQKFYKEKLKPFIINTQPLAEKIGNLSKVAYSHIPFPGGFLALVTTGSAEDLKSSVIPIIIVEEPDGVKGDVNSQGDGMAILQQRLKSFSDSKLIYAGTPTDHEFSQVIVAYEASNKMVYMVPCHKCGDSHSLSFDNLKCDKFQDRRIDELYGVYNPATAYYECPNCKEIWTFEQKNKNVREAINFFNKGWTATRPEIDTVVGFAFNELLSSFPKSDFVSLMQQQCKAEVAYAQGKVGLLKSFVNNSKGEGYQPVNVDLDLKQLINKRKDYKENVVVYEGLILTAGVDVQHNRLAWVVRAWGRNGNSWLVTWFEIFGNTSDRENLVWSKAEELLFQKWQHAASNTAFLKIAALSIDSGDGNLTEVVYQWVLDMSEKHPHVFAVKGFGDNEERPNDLEIFNEPPTIDITTAGQVRRTLAQTMGVNVFPIGAYKAHCEVLRRMKLDGSRDRMYHCKTDYGKYEEGILSCVRHPVKKSFVKKASAAKEAIDCEKMALHASYAIQVRSYTNRHWEELERSIYSTIKH